MHAAQWRAEVLLPPPERYLNHSWVPNVYLKTGGGELRVVARQPIASGEELTLDYLINRIPGYLEETPLERPSSR